MPNALDPVVSSFELATEVPPHQLLALPRFFSEMLAEGNPPEFAIGPRKAIASPQGHYVEFTASSALERYECHVRMYLTSPITVEIRSGAGRNEAFEARLRDLLLVVVQFYEDHLRESTLYMSFVPGSPKTAEVTGRRSLSRAVFSGNMMNIFLLSFVLGVFYFLLFGDLAPILLLLTMLVLVLSAGKISAWRSPWRITEKDREVLVVEYRIPEEELKGFTERHREALARAKQRAYEVFSSCPGMLCAEDISKIFAEAGLPADPKSFVVKRVDVYAIVERVAKRFRFPVPTIVISRDARPNAAATGFTKSLATMFITSGLLVQLTEEEVELVVGHELSHLRTGDPMIMFSLIAAEYLLRVYVYWQYVASFWLIYLLAIFWGIFFFGKFLESKSDIEAALVMRKPKVMAESLKKIGYRRLVLEERFLEPNVSRFREWMRFDPHPPLYFRIRRLDSLDLSNPPRHTFLSSVRAVIAGFARSGRTQ